LVAAGCCVDAIPVVDGVVLGCTEVDAVDGRVDAAVWGL
jgi:hypothetical protein